LGREALLARTGYTGEDGFEVFLAPEDAPAVFEALVKAGAAPAGLGARDTLRLEMGYPLYGHDIALAWVQAPYAEEGVELAVEIRGRRHPARVHPLPFIRR